MTDQAHASTSETGNIGNRLVIAPDGVHLDGHKLPATDELSIEHVADDFHIVSLKLYVTTVEAAERHRVSTTAATVYHYVHDAPGGQT